MTLQEKLRQVRLTKGLTLQEVAGALGLKSRASVQHWESGYRVPKLSSLKKLAKLYGVDVTYFILDD
ncbi:MAG TPA: helix-turn-helix transcriptional regulator [Clostridia bacterium]